MMECILEAYKLEKFGDGVCGKNFETDRRKKKFNTASRRERMFRKIQEKPEKFVTNYAIMVNNLGIRETETKIKNGIKDIFRFPTCSKVTLFSKDSTRRRSLESKGKFLLSNV